MDPSKGPPNTQPTPTANAPTPVAVNPLNGRPIFLNTLPPLPDVRSPIGGAAASEALPTVGPASTAAPAAPPGKLQSYALHFAMCQENCSSAISYTLVIVALFVASVVFMFVHYKRRSREMEDEEEPVQSVSTKFTPSRDLRSPFEGAKGFSSFDEYSNNRAMNTDSYYEDDYVEGYVGVAGFAAPKENRQSSHAGVGGFGVNRNTHEPMPPLPMLNVPPPPMPPSAEEQQQYDAEFADYQDEWEKYQRDEAAAQGIPYHGGHESTVEGMYFSPQVYDDGGQHRQQQHSQMYAAHEMDVDEDNAFEPSPYFQPNPMQYQDEHDDDAQAVHMPQFEVEDYYVRDHLDTTLAPTATGPTAPINWMNAEEKSYWEKHHHK